MMRELIIIACLFVASLFVCNCSRPVTPEGSKPEKNQDGVIIRKAGPPAIIYRTKNDYFDKVPVNLSENHDRVTGYPSQKDIVTNEGFSYPSRLINGFLLDNRGIGKHSAFLDLSYDAYSKLQDEISAEFLLPRIIDHDPFLEIYDCGSRFQFKDIITELNELIELNQFERCIKLR
jgi:hypothetical protein